MSKAWTRLYLDAGIARVNDRRRELLARQQEIIATEGPSDTVDFESLTELRNIDYELHKLDQREAYCTRMKGTVQ